jgi:alcohol dehydrogenase class IV
MLMHCVRLIAGRFETGADLDEVGVRGDIAVAAILCGQGTDHTGAGITTVLGHALGARFGVENGTVNAVVLPHVLDFNGAFAASGCAKVGAAFGLAGAPADLLPTLVSRLTAMFGALGLPSRLRDIAIPADALRQTAELAMSDWFLRGNPRPVTHADELFEILQRSW